MKVTYEHKPAMILIGYQYFSTKIDFAGSILEMYLLGNAEKHGYCGIEQ